MVSQRLAVRVCGAELALPPSTRAAAPGWFRVCVLGLSAAEVELSNDQNLWMSLGEAA